MIPERYSLHVSTKENNTSCIHANKSDPLCVSTTYYFPLLNSSSLTLRKLKYLRSPDSSYTLRKFLSTTWFLHGVTTNTFESGRYLSSFIWRWGSDGKLAEIGLQFEINQIWSGVLLEFRQKQPWSCQQSCHFGFTNERTSGRTKENLLIITPIKYTEWRSRRNK